MRAGVRKCASAVGHNLSCCTERNSVDLEWLSADCGGLRIVMIMVMIITIIIGVESESETPGVRVLVRNWSRESASHF